MYNLSHTSSEHRFKQVKIDVPDTPPAGNNATIDVDVETRGKDNEDRNCNNKKKENTKKIEDEDDIVDDIQYEGAWMAEVCNDDGINVVAITAPSIVPTLPFIPGFYDVCIDNMKLCLRNDTDCFDKLSRDTKESDEISSSYDNVFNH